MKTIETPTIICGQVPEFDINGFTASHLIFDQSHYATIWAKCRFNGKLQEMHLIVSFEKLNDILRFSGKKGEEILLAMVDKMMLNTAPPYMLDFKELLGTDAIFTNIKLKVNEVSNDNILSTDAKCCLINEVWPINIIEQAKNLEQHGKDFQSTAILSESLMIQSMHQLADRYLYYLGLLELELSEEAAKSRAQLSDIRLFVMAKNAAQIA
jgi:hypothetical protein